MIKHVPFNGDTYIGPEIRKLITRWGIKSIIETGMWSAHTTREFIKMCPKVITIDPTWDHLFEEFGPTAINDLIKLGIKPIKGDSSKCLTSVIDDYAEAPILFYLDAHGGGENNSNVNPFLEELDQISGSDRCKDTCVIAIHDFQVPGKDFGYNGGDWGKGWEPLSYTLIRDYLSKIYTKGYNYHYNEKADGLCRGIIYIYPKGS
jgi:hypothetical protein